MELTAEEKQRVQRARQEAESEKEEILAMARRIKATRQAAAVLREAFQLLKAERQSQGLSLAEVEERTGIDQEALAQLENDVEADLTVATLLGYSEALGKKLVVRFE